MNENIQAHLLDSIRTKDVLIEENVSFQSMLLSPKCLEGLDKCGFQKPSPIQLKAIPLGRCGFDLIVKSKSGTGKTMVFSVVSLESLDLSSSSLQVLVLAPTREIAVQIANTMEAVGKYFEGFQVNSFIGGFPEKDDKKKAQSCQIAVGAPGRVRSLIEKNILDVSSVKLFILDEADKLMEKSFLQDVNEIYQRLPQKKQIIATSATYPNNLDDFLSKYMQCPTYVSSENDTQLLLGLKHFIKEVKSSSNTAQQIKIKNEELHKLLSNIPFTQCIIFSNYQTRAENISISLNRNGWDSMFISGAQNQQKRLETMNKLKNFKCRILLSTDLTARGIDASNVDLVINYDIPLDVSTYLHRMGRAGRYGSRGVCISLVAGEKDLLQIRKFLGNIGGSNLTITKLGEIENGMKDLWSLGDDPKFEKISGIFDGNEDAIHTIKDEILSLKNNCSVIEGHNCQTNESEIKSSSKQEIKKESCLKLTDEEKQIASHDKVIELELITNEKIEITEALNEKCDTNEKIIESTSCLESLAKGTFNFESIPSPPNIFFGETKETPFKDFTENLFPDKVKKVCENNSDLTLKSLAEGTFDFNNLSSLSKSENSVENCSKNILGYTKKLESISDSNTMMNNLTDNLPHLDEKYGKTRKSSELENDNHSKISKNEVFIKNKGIYEVARILNNTTDFDLETEVNLNNYLKLLKKQTLNSFTPETIVKSEDNCLEKNFAEKKIDALFTTAYLFAIDKERDDWRKFVNSNDFLQNNQSSNGFDQISNNNLMQEDEEDYEEVDDDAYEETDGEYVEEDQPQVEYDENGYEYIPNRMVWVPVEEDISKVSSQIPQINLLDEDDHHNHSVSQPYQEAMEPFYGNYSQNISNTHNPDENQTADSDLYWDKHFSDCFYQCQVELCTKSSTFKTAKDFEKWYVHSWQKRLDEVREYVKQNIFVREMSEYQRINKQYHFNT